LDGYTDGKCISPPSSILASIIQAKPHTVAFTYSSSYV
jgi:hypothetical protein